jgi:tetratricopeptide (TPR) repeat protein
LPLVSDLGIAKEVTIGDTTGTGSASSQGLGTLGYMPPEQVNDAREAGFPADVFALGAILYECLAGRKAFEGGLISFAKVVAEGPLPLAKVRPEVPDDLALAIERALASRPGERFTDAKALARALEVKRRSRALPLLVTLSLAAGGAVALALWHAHAASSRRAGAREALAAAHRLERDLDHKGARAELDRAIELDPLLADAWGYRGGIRVQLGEVEAARGDIAHALELDKDCAVAYECRGEVEFVRNEVEAAIADFTHALELDPRIHEAWNNRGVARARKGNPTAAVADLSRAIEIEPASGDAWFNRAAIERQENPDRALADATRAVELRPRMSEAWQLRGMLRFAHGDRDEAVSDLGRAIELAPKEESSWRLRGSVRQVQGDFDGAFADFTRAIELAPAVPDSWGYRASIHQRRGESEAAIADYERYIGLAGDAALPEARAALEKLRAAR